MRTIITAAFLAVAFGTPVRADGLLNPLFGDHAVLQRGTSTALYGKASPGAVIHVTLGAVQAAATTGPDGSWLARLPAMPEGGPYTLEVDGDGQHQVVNDLMVGDVFLCAGQSNMARTVRQSADSETEISAATDSMVRAVNLRGAVSLNPAKSFARVPDWQIESPQTVGAFSASCFYFARELRKHVHVPIGLVMAAAGGTRARGWLSETALSRLPVQAESMTLLSQYRRDPVAAQAAWDKTWEAAWHAHSPSAPWKADTESWVLAGSNLGDWSTWPGLSVPEGLGEPGVGFVGQLWLSSHVALSADQARQAATLNLGRVTEEEKSWVNGQGVGGNAGGAAHHTLAAGLLHAGDNRIMLSIFCSWKNCGLNGPAADRNITLADGTIIALDRPWRFMTDTDWIAPQIPWGAAHGLEQQYNGLIAPIGPYTVKAAIWYQGESDIYFARDYQQTLSGLMVDWRMQFGANLPFVVVQIPQYGPPPTHPVSSVWSDLRETQRKAVAADPHAALVVTLDVGDAKNLHPADKQDVGRRIALAMRKLAYGEQVAASGPVGASAHARGKTVVVAFRDVDGALASVSGRPNAFELCTGKSCRWANAHVAGNTVILDGRAGRMRYCWGDSPVCNLTDASGLPAGPFELDVH